MNDSSNILFSNCAAVKKVCGYVSSAKRRAKLYKSIIKTSTQMARKPLSAEEQRQKELEEIRRTPTPRPNQVLGICEQRVGGSRMKVRCLDGKTRICRIPGRLKRRLWVRERDILLIEPWELGGDDKGDVVYKYRPLQADVLKKKGLLKDLVIEEF